MKQQLVILFIALFTQTAFAQNQKKSVDAYAITTAEIASFNHKTALGIGGYGGVLLNKKWFIGLGGSNLLFKHTVSNNATRFQFNQYGAYAEKHFFNTEKVHLTTGIFAGGGWLNYVAKETGKKLKMDGDYTYVIQPRIAVTVPVFKFMQFQAHSSYRFTGSVNGVLYNVKNMNGVNGGVSLLFGSF